MCGIVGYRGVSSPLRLLLDGLKKLEYRGYDSAGIAYQNGIGLEIYKIRGKLNDLCAILPNPLPTIRIGLGHTRWATHGSPSTVNAHPHTVRGITVVHNGIIENYRELKAELQRAGNQFLSETDTEVIPHLISTYVDEGLPLRKAIERAAARLRGSYALGIMSDQMPDVLFAVRQGSPLVIGIGNGNSFFASDVPALLPFTNNVLFMEDGQICSMSDEGIELCQLGNDVPVAISERAVTVSWTAEMAEKDGHDHFMHKEICEQPRSIANTISEWIDDPTAIFPELGIFIMRKGDVRAMHVAACGTSYHAALFGKYLIERLTRIPVSVEIASEYRYRNPILEEGTLFLSITQSGETADTLAAQREAKKRGARTVTICNVVGSTCSREADSVLYTRSGPEIGVASTKTFTAQMAALCLFAIALGVDRGTIAREEAGSLSANLRNVPNLIQETLSADAQIKELARSLTTVRSCIFLGRGLNYPLALEGALKLKEISYICAEGHAAGEMKHGPIAMIERGLPVIVLAPVDELFEKVLSNIEEVNARGARVIAITNNRSALEGNADEIILVPNTHPYFSPFVNSVPLQLLAYHVGVLKGCDVDQPRNLAKSVTVE